jgi:hypothetical protein
MGQIGVSYPRSLVSPDRVFLEVDCPALSLITTFSLFSIPIAIVKNLYLDIQLFLSVANINISSEVITLHVSPCVEKE